MKMWLPLFGQLGDLTRSQVRLHPMCVQVHLHLVCVRVLTQCVCSPNV